MSTSSATQPALFWGDDEEGERQIGDWGFLVERTHVTKGWTRYHLYDRPAHTNMGGCPKLNGWCGTTDDVSVHAYGVGEVVRIARNGRVAYCRVTEPEVVTQALDELGYPGLDE